MTSSMQNPETYSKLLQEQHNAKNDYHPLPTAVAGKMDFALAVQDSSIRRWSEQGEDIAGWKIGLTSKTMQQLCGVAEPIQGAILSSLVKRSPARLQSSNYGRLGLEMEIAVRLREVPAPDTFCTAATILPLVDQVAAAFEIIDDRNADYSRLDAYSLVADNSWNAGIVLGKPVAMSAMRTLPGRSGVLFRGGEQFSQGKTGDADGDPLDGVAWLIGALRKRGRELVPGDWVMTGSFVPTVFPQPSETWKFAVDDLPAVEVAID